MNEEKLLKLKDMTFEEFIEFTKIESKRPAVMIENIINESTNQYMLLDKLYRLPFDDRMMSSYISNKQVNVKKIIPVVISKLDGYNYESVIQEVMSLFE